MRAPNLALGLASLVLSVAFWIYVQSQRVETFDETVELPLQVYGLNPDYSILRTPKAKISVTANGTVADIIKFRAQLADAINSGKAPSLGLIAVLDLSAARPEDEETEYPVRLPRNDVTRQAGIRFKNSPDLPVVVVYRSRRRIPIQIETENIPEGFGVSMATLEPKDMFVGGPKRDLERVDHASGRVNLGDYKPGRTYPVTLKAVDKDGLEIKTVSLEATSVIYTPILSIAAPEKSVLIDVVFKPGTRPAPGYRLK
ncbi:MAG: CdaR family protein, partial [Fimbriimonadaceae bacterium]